MVDPVKQFHQEMINVYERAKEECGYNATRFLQMVSEMGGLEAARALLHTPGLSDGLIALWKCRRLDITMESVILNPRWRSLFSEAELTIARTRLKELGYQPR